MTQLDERAAQALEHIRHLSVIVGGRGSCSAHERLAAEYTARKMHEMGITEVRLEPYRGAPSTYRPYALVFGLAAVSTLVAWLLESPWTAALAALVHALGMWGMVAETDLAANWMRLILPKAEAHNAVGVIPAAGEVRQRAILCAHLDTHRTPIFYSSERWRKLFPYLVALAFLSLVVGAVAYGLLAIFGWELGLWIGAFSTLVQVVAVDLFLHADRTPFSPGANDNASGVGVVLTLARQFVDNPLEHTEVWLAFTGCEETGAYGMAAFLDAAESGDAGSQFSVESLYVILDQVGAGQVSYLTADGPLLKRKTHPRALEIARQAAAALPDLEIRERVGIAYTDALVATRRGLVALTLASLPPAGSAESTYWHQMSDTLERIDPQALVDVHRFTRQVLTEMDKGVEQ